MKTLSPLALQILPMLTGPVTVSSVHDVFADDTSVEEVETALDELVPHHATCDEHEGVPYYYRRDTAAEQDRKGQYADAVRAATHARDMALALAHTNFAAAVEEADADRDASDPMAAIKGMVAA